MIVKVQLPLSTTEPAPLAMIYDEKRTFTAMVPVTKEIIKAMGGKPKAFFHAHRDSKNVFLDEIADWQTW